MIRVLVIKGKNESVGNIMYKEFDNIEEANIFINEINTHATEKYYSFASIIDTDVEYDVYGTDYGNPAYIM